MPSSWKMSGPMSIERDDDVGKQKCFNDGFIFAPCFPGLLFTAIQCIKEKQNIELNHLLLVFMEWYDRAGRCRLL